jgi:hypothetical protein
VLFLEVDHRIFLAKLVTCLQLLPHDVHVGCKVYLWHIRTFHNPYLRRHLRVPLKVLPHQSEVQDVSTPPPQVEHTDSLEDFRITNTREDYRIHCGERPFVQLNPSEEAVVTSSESTVGPSSGVVGQDPLWSGDFR